MVTMFAVLMMLNHAAADPVTVPVQITGRLYDATEIRQDEQTGVWLRCFQGDCQPAYMDPDGLIRLDEGSG